MHENDRLIKQFVRDPAFTVPVILTAVAAYAYQLLNLSIGIDDLVCERYTGGVLASQGRFSSTFLHYLFGFEGFTPYIKGFFGVFFLCVSALLFSVVLKKASGDRLPRAFYTFFSCIFISYPLISEIFVYKGADMNTGLGYALTAVGLLFAENAISYYRRNKRLFVFNFVYAVITWIFIISLYEAFAFVYVLAVCLVLFLEKANGNDAVKKIVIYALPLVLGTAAEFLIGLVVKAVVKFEYVGKAGSGIAFSLDLKSVLFQLFRKLILAGIWYLPVALFAIAGLISIPLFIVSAVKNKKPIIMLYAVGVWFSLLAMGFLTAGCLKYRTCMSFAPFVAFIFTYLGVIIVKKWNFRPVKACVWLLGIMLVASQAVAINGVFAANVARFSEEKRVVEAAGAEIREAQKSGKKPVVFIGEYRLSDSAMSEKFVRSDDEAYVNYVNFMKKLGFSPETYDFDETYVIGKALSDYGSLISWGTDDNYNCNEELLLFFRYLGFDIEGGTNEQYEAFSSRISEFDAGLNECGDVYVYRWN